LRRALGCPGRCRALAFGVHEQLSARAEAMPRRGRCVDGRRPRGRPSLISDHRAELLATLPGTSPRAD
jgi:hypothetical protein